jgi:hypothetical protein
VRLADGRVFCGELPAWRHRALQLGMLHAQSEGLVELTPGTRPPGGKVKINRRTDARHYLPGGAGAKDGRWLERLLEHAERIVRGEYAFECFDGEPREEAFGRRRAAHRAARQQGRGRAHALFVAGRRQARPARSAVGLPSRAAVSAAVRVRRAPVACTATGS